MAESGNMDLKVHEHRSRTRLSDLLLRSAAITFTLAAALLLGLNKQTKVVQVQLVPTLPPMSLSLTAKWHYLSAFKFFVVANSIASVHAMLSLLLTALASKKGPFMAVIILDLFILGLLFSSLGAAGAVGILGQYGNNHLRWNKVCNNFDKFCHQAETSLALSFVASLVFLLLIIFAVRNLHIKSKQNS